MTYQLTRRERDALRVLADADERLIKRKVAERAVERGCPARHPRAWINKGLRDLRHKGLAESTQHGVAITPEGAAEAETLEEPDHD